MYSGVFLKTSIIHRLDVYFVFSIIFFPFFPHLFIFVFSFLVIFQVCLMYDFSAVSVLSFTASSSHVHFAIGFLISVGSLLVQFPSHPSSQQKVFFS